VGHVRAAQPLLLAEPITADQAHQLGLVTEVVEAGSHLARAGSVPGRLREEMAIVRQQLARPEFASAARRIHPPECVCRALQPLTQRPTRNASVEQFSLRHRAGSDSSAERLAETVNPGET